MSSENYDPAADLEQLCLRLEQKPQGRKRQHWIEEIGLLWQKPLYHWVKVPSRRYRHQAIPTEQVVRLVASFINDVHPPTRLAVISALGQSGEFVRFGISAIMEGLQDTHFAVRLNAYRVAFELKLEHELPLELIEKGLNDPLWTVRWYAAALLANTDKRNHAYNILQAHRPHTRSERSMREDWWLDLWRSCLNAFETDTKK